MCVSYHLQVKFTNYWACMLVIRGCVSKCACVRVCACVCGSVHDASVCVIVFLALETDRSHFKAKLLVGLPKV